MRKRARKSYIMLSMFLCLICTFSFGEKVAKFAWKGSLAGFDNTIINPPNKTVAMSEYVYISTDFLELTEKDPCSIMFIIDNSISNDQSDPSAQRFKVTRDLIDEIYKEAPETKIGLSIFGSRHWFYGPDNSNKDVFVSNPNDQFHQGDGCYIAPLSLKKVYTGTARGFGGGSQSYSKTGLEILKWYLETAGNSTRYEPTHNTGQWTDIKHNARLTNITRSIDGANQGHLNPPAFKKNRHFNIFLSDGVAGVDARNPDKAYERDFIQGRNTPATFTIFYGSSSAPADLQNMTNAIKNNGYSNMNQEVTQIVAMTNWQSIKAEIKKLFKKILTNTNTTPVKVTINASSSSNWNDSNFVHKNHFPLDTGMNPMDMELKINIFREILDDQGNVIDTVDKDTIINYDWNIVVGPTDTLPDSLEMTWWGRDIGLFDKGTQVNSVTADMDELELRFWEYKVDTTLGYKKAEVLMTTLSSGDSEKMKLNASGSHFAKKFKIALSSSANKNDGILQVTTRDTICLLYKNPGLPLDTIKVLIPYNEDLFVEVHDGTYYDKDGDGKVDEVFVKVTGPRVEKHFKDIAKEIKFPSYRKFQYGNSDISFSATTGRIKFSVDEDMSGVQTYVTSKDRYEIKDSVKLDEDLFLIPSKGEFSDSIAPIIMKARLKDSVLVVISGNTKDTTEIIDDINDTLVVEFSEDVKEIKQNKPFKFFYTDKGDTYDVTLKLHSQKDEKATFVVEKVDGADKIAKGDSIRINWIDKNVVDKEGNNQGNKNNIRREIEVKQYTRDSVYYVIPDLSFVLKTPFIRNADPKGIATKKMKGVMKHFGVNEKNITEHSLIVVELEDASMFSDLDSLSGTVQLFDALGNEVLSKKTLYYHKEWNKLFYLWDGKNNAGRGAGRNTYFVTTEVTHHFNKQLSRKYTPVKSKTLNGVVGRQ